MSLDEDFLANMRRAGGTDVRPFLARGAKSNIQDPISLKTPLHYAVQWVDLAGVRALLAADANPLLEDRGHLTPRAYAESLPKGVDAQKYRDRKEILEEIARVLAAAEQKPVVTATSKKSSRKRAPRAPGR